MEQKRIIYTAALNILHLALDDDIPNWRRWEKDPDDLPHYQSYYDQQACLWGTISGYARNDLWIDFIGVTEPVLELIVTLVEPQMFVRSHKRNALSLKKKVAMALFHFEFPKVRNSVHGSKVFPSLLDLP